MEVELKNGILESEEGLLYENAVFLAERLVAHSSTEANLCILAEQLIRIGKYKRVAQLLRKCSSKRALYLRALTFVKLGELEKAERILTQGKSTISPYSMIPFDDNAASWYLLGRIYQYTARKELACRAYQHAVEKNPLFWCAFESLASLGQVSTDILSVYGDEQSEKQISDAENRKMLFQNSHDENSNRLNENTVLESSPKTPAVTSRSVLNLPSTLNPKEEACGENEEPESALKILTDSWRMPDSPLFSVQKREENMELLSADKYSSRRLESSAMFDPMTLETPSPPVSTSLLMNNKNYGMTGDAANNQRAPPPPRKDSRSMASTARTARGAGQHAPARSRLSFQRDDDTISPRIDTQTGKKSTSHTSQFRAAAVSIRTPSQLQPPVSSNTASHTKSQHVQLGASELPAAFKTPEQRHVSESNDRNINTVSSNCTITQVMRKLASAVSQMHRLECSQALEAFFELPPSQYQTAYVMACVGRCWLELAEYRHAQHAFQRALELDSARLEGCVELYSTVLWHTRDEVKLAELGNHALEIDRNSAAAWCAAGNSASLQHSRALALKCFKKASQLNPYFAYAHTLAGHEYIMGDEIDSAEKEYRAALAIDHRHYNAWYGLGHVYARRQQHEKSMENFRYALTFHSKSATLHYHVGCILSAAGDYPAALREFRISLELDRSSAVTKFELAKVLYSLKDYSEASKYLTELVALLPREAAIRYELGRIAKREKRIQDAIAHYSAALEIDPKEKMYKKALDSLQDADKPMSSSAEHTPT